MTDHEASCRVAARERTAYVALAQEWAQGARAWRTGNNHLWRMNAAYCLARAAGYRRAAMAV